MATHSFADCSSVLADFQAAGNVALGGGSAAGLPEGFFDKVSPPVPDVDTGIKGVDTCFHQIPSVQAAEQDS